MPNLSPDAAAATTEPQPIQRALLSVSDKSGLVELARALHAHGVELLASGGTAQALAKAGLTATSVEDWLNAPAMLGGRVKTLHPKLHGSLLARPTNARDKRDIAHHGLQPIDLLVVNLYPFADAVAQGKDFAACVEEMDIGGPAMLRAAAKNMAHVCVVTEPQDYAALLDEWQAHGGTRLAFRRRLAQKAFARASLYDSEIAAWLAQEVRSEGAEFTPPIWTTGGRLQQELRYGENPHQRAAFYALGRGPGYAQGRGAGLARAEQVQGKALSYNNLLDADAARALISDLPTDLPTCAIFKHANPCGVGRGKSLREAFVRARACDPVSAFGGIIACNQALDEATAKAIAAMFSEVIVAPDADGAARAALARKKNLRLLLLPALAEESSAQEVRAIDGGLLVQERDRGGWPANARLVTRRAPTAQEDEDLRLAWIIVKHVKSNAIVLVKQGQLIGVGAGQMSRLDAVAQAIRSAQTHVPSSDAQADVSSAAAPPADAPPADVPSTDAPAVPDATLQRLGKAFKPQNGTQNGEGAATAVHAATAGAVMASDAFFPFPDGLQRALEVGITAVAQPGGSVRDADLIKTADTADIAMLFTGRRHFRH